MEVLPLGDSALLVRLANSAGVSDIRAASERIAALALPEVVELVPAYNSIGVFYRDATLEELKLRLEAALSTNQPASPETQAPVRELEIAVCYDSEFALDLSDVAEHAGLSPEEVVQRHSSAEYIVSCVGFAPGFPYLSGLPQELATPRRASPRKEVPAGSVAIGGAQTGIYPQKSPGGWNIIGRTPLRLFDLEQQPPALLRAGDRVRFHAISRAEFDATPR
jgi:inhibitor of KinA